MAQQRGFTLVELLVVFAIAALLVAVAPPALERMRSGAEYRNTLRLLGSELRLARQLAQTGGRTVAFELDLEGRRFGVPGRVAQVLPASVQVEATVAGQSISTGRVASILFLPEGGATGGSIDVLRANGEGSRVRVDWFSGRTEIERIQP